MLVVEEKWEARKWCVGVWKGECKVARRKLSDEVQVGGRKEGKSFCWGYGARQEKIEKYEEDVEELLAKTSKTCTIT